MAHKILKTIQYRLNNFLSLRAAPSADAARFLLLGASIAALVAGCTFLASAQDRALSGNPYASITSRNIFGLVPAPPIAINQVVAQVQPPQITACGTMTILGQPQVVFRLAGILKPGTTASETSHILAVGERELNVTVLNISADGESITFDNNGTIQVLKLTEAPKPWKPDDLSYTIIGPIPDHFGGHRTEIQ